jgi:hypothetical protein
MNARGFVSAVAQLARFPISFSFLTLHHRKKVTLTLLFIERIGQWAELTFRPRSTTNAKLTHQFLTNAKGYP